MRHDHLDLATAGASAHPLLDDLGFLDLLRQHNLLRDAGGLRVELLDELGHHLVIGRILCAFQDEVFAPDQFSCANEKNLHASLVVSTRHGDHV